jgi:hypothetical protein
MHIVRAFCICAMLGAAAGFTFIARRENTPQIRVPWRVVGDTSRGRHNCSAAAGIAAINQWFGSFNAADSVGLAKATAVRGPRGFVFSTGRFTHAEKFFVTHSISSLVAYARKRARQHERMRIQEVKFNGWRYGALQFGPICFLRSADDLGRKPLLGMGKGGYRCNYGLAVLNVGPRPAPDSAPCR